jgi:hypothetical protein
MLAKRQNQVNGMGEQQQLASSQQDEQHQLLRWQPVNVATAGAPTVEGY